MRKSHSNGTARIHPNVGDVDAQSALYMARRPAATNFDIVCSSTSPAGKLSVEKFAGERLFDQCRVHAGLESKLPEFAQVGSASLTQELLVYRVRSRADEGYQVLLGFVHRKVRVLPLCHVTERGPSLKKLLPMLAILEAREIVQLPHFRPNGEVRVRRRITLQLLYRGDNLPDEAPELDPALNVPSARQKLAQGVDGETRTKGGGHDRPPTL